MTTRPRPRPDLPVPPPTATISESRFGFHASYTAGIGRLEVSHFAFTRKGIERKARRMLASLNRDVARRNRNYELQ